MKHQNRGQFSWRCRMSLCVDKTEIIKLRRFLYFIDNQLITSKHNKRVGFRSFMAMKSALLTFLMFWSILSVGQIGAWNAYIPKSSFLWAGELPSTYAFANKQGVILYSHEEGSVYELNKVQGLTSSKITSFECFYDEGLCMVGYDDGNIDLINEDGQVINQPAIKASNRLGDKAVYDIDLFEGKALISSGIGLLTLDFTSFDIIEHRELVFDEEIVPVYSLQVHEPYSYCLSTEGVFRLGSNPLGEEPLEFLPFDKNEEYLKDLFLYQNNVCVSYVTPEYKEDTLYQIEDGSFTELELAAGEEFRFLRNTDEFTLISVSDAVIKFDLNGTRLEHIFTYGPVGMNSNEVFVSRTGQIVIADEAHGGVITSFENQFNSTFIQSSSPKRNQISQLSFVENRLFALPGGNQFTFNVPYMHSLTENEWTSQLLYPNGLTGTTNPVDVEFCNDILYVASDGSGVISMTTELETTDLLNDANSALEDIDTGSYSYIGVTDMTTDGSNLWLLNSKSEQPLKVLHKNGEWSTMAIPGFTKPITRQILRLTSGIIVINLAQQGLVFYDYNDTPKNLDDDRFVNINSSPSAGALPNDNVQCIAEDNDGELWIGTDEGIGVMYSPENVFSGSENVQQILVNQDGYFGHLFESDIVTAIEVDGGNRKWVSTQGGGVFLISADGTEQLEHFSATTSPLLSNQITDIAIHPKTGEVFFASEEGLHSYTSDATQSEAALEDIKVFPNPVKPSYEGVVSIDGLTDGSYVRITDVSGNVITETTSLGGRATWDVKTVFGDRVPSGVYLVFVATAEGTGGEVGKVLVLGK